MSTVPEIRPIWRAENVTIADVVDAARQIRYDYAVREGTDDEHMHPRNCVMTLVGVAHTAAHEHIAVRTTQAIGTQHPAQAIVVREEAPAAGRHLDAWITNGAQPPHKTCAVDCEVITLHVFGEAAEHLAGLVDPLLVAGLPTYLWWLGTPPFGKHEMLDALKVVDGLVVDSADFDEPYRTFDRMSNLLKVAHHRLGLGDLAWARLRPWRETVAQFFAPADRRNFLGGISELGVDYAGEGRGNRIAAALATGWIASALGWKLRHAQAGTGGVVAAVYESNDRSIEVRFRSVAQVDRVPGEVSALRIAGMAGGATFRLSVMHDPPRARTRATSAYEADRRRDDTGRVLLTLIEMGDSEPLRHIQQLEPEDAPALLLDLLSTGTHDEVFNRSLKAASALMDAM